MFHKKSLLTGPTKKYSGISKTTAVEFILVKLRDSLNDNSIHYTLFPWIFPIFTIYKSFIRPNLKYGDVRFDQKYKARFHEKLESFQYNTALAITGPISGNFQRKSFPGTRLEITTKSTLEEKQIYLACKKLLLLVS